MWSGHDVTAGGKPYVATAVQAIFDKAMPTACWLVSSWADKSREGGR
jgi:hypothetical protein